jgi:hypothetical protein
MEMERLEQYPLVRHYYHNPQNNISCHCQEENLN